MVGFLCPYSAMLFQTLSGWGYKPDILVKHTSYCRGLKGNCLLLRWIFLLIALCAQFQSQFFRETLKHDLGGELKSGYAMDNTRSGDALVRNLLWAALTSCCFSYQVRSTDKWDSGKYITETSLLVFQLADLDDGQVFFKHLGVHNLLICLLPTACVSEAHLGPPSNVSALRSGPLAQPQRQAHWLMGTSLRQILIQVLAYTCWILFFCKMIFWQGCLYYF